MRTTRAAARRVRSGAPKPRATAASANVSRRRVVTSALTTRDSIVETEAAHDPGEMVGAARPPIDEHDAQVRPGAGDHQAGNTATAAEVDHGAGLAGEGGDECHGVLDDLRDRPTPSMPKPCDAPSAATSSASSFIRVFGWNASAWGDHDAAVGIVALGAAGHAIDGGEGVVEDLAVGRRHRVERASHPRRLDLFGHGGGEALQRLPALLPVAGDIDASRVSWSPRRRWAATRARSCTASSVRPPGPISRPSEAPSTRTSISLPSTLASTDARTRRPRSARRRTRRQPGGRRPHRAARGIRVHRWSWSFLRGGRAVGSARQPRGGSGVGRARGAVSGAGSPPRRPRRRSCFGRAGVGRTRARTRASPRRRPNRPGLGAVRTSNSASSAITPSWSRASSWASSTVRAVVSTHSIMHSASGRRRSAPALPTALGPAAARTTGTRLGAAGVLPVGVGRPFGGVVRFEVARAAGVSTFGVGSRLVWLNSPPPPPSFLASSRASSLARWAWRPSDSSWP